MYNTLDLLSVLCNRVGLEDYMMFMVHQDPLSFAQAF